MKRFMVDSNRCRPTLRPTLHRNGCGSSAFGPSILGSTTRRGAARRLGSGDLVHDGIVDGHAKAAGGGHELRMQILPFTDAQVVQVLHFAHLAELVAGQRFHLPFEVVPQAYESNKIRSRVDEPGMVCDRLVTLFERILTDITDSQCRNDNEGLGKAAPLVRFDEYPSKSGVDRKLRELAADASEAHCGTA